MMRAWRAALAAFAGRATLAAVATLAGPAGAADVSRAAAAATALPSDPPRLGVWFGGGPAAGFAQATEPRHFVFPRDHGPHREFRHEWWYVSGNLDTDGGERFGFELTFFRFALAPPAVAPSGPAAAASVRVTPGAAVSAWRANTIYMAHFAVSDVARRRFRFEQRLAREALGLAGVVGQPLRLWIDDWSLARHDSAPAAGQWTLHAAQPSYEIELTLEETAAPLLNGAAGLSRKADEPSAASYYYSLPRLAARGRLWREGQRLEVHGEAWLDREWSSGGLGAQEVGWDWFALQFADGSSLMFYALRDRDGRRDVHSAGSWSAPSGDRRALSDAEVAITVTDTWRSNSGERYPAGWRVRVPALALELSVRPVLADQELRTSPRYWEGAVDVEGARAGSPVRGRGYVELVGYARER